MPYDNAVFNLIISSLVTISLCIYIWDAFDCSKMLMKYWLESRAAIVLFTNHSTNYLYFITWYFIKMSICQDAEDNGHKYEYDDEAKFFARILFPRKVVFIIWFRILIWCSKKLGPRVHVYSVQTHVANSTFFVFYQEN